MPIDFPNTPAPNEIFVVGDRSWKWNNTSLVWESVAIPGPIGPTGAAGATGPTGPAGSISTSVLDNLSDVVITTPANNQVLKYNGTAWVNGTDADTIYTLPKATSTTLGGVDLFSDTVQSVAANAVSATASRTYGVQLNSSDQAVVNVPWVDTNTTYTAGTGLNLSGGNQFSINYGTTQDPSLDTITASSIGRAGLVQSASLTGAYTLGKGDGGKHVYSTASRLITIPGDATGTSPLPFEIGTTIVLIAGSGATVTISMQGGASPTTDTLILAGVGTSITGANPTSPVRTLAPFGMATLVKVTATSWFISGTGLT